MILFYNMIIQIIDNIDNIIIKPNSLYIFDIDEIILTFTPLKI